MLTLRLYRPPSDSKREPCSPHIMPMVFRMVSMAQTKQLLGKRTVSFSARTYNQSALTIIGILDAGPSSEKRKVYEPVVYGEFLSKKVANNFDSGKGKYD